MTDLLDIYRTINITESLQKIKFKMYDAASAIEVYIRPYREDIVDSKEQYAEYEAPRGTPFYTGNPRERYIEAVTDERYEIVTILHPTFVFKGNQCVKIQQSLDDSLYASCYLKAQDKRPKTAMTDIANEVPALIDGKWQSVGFSFGSVCPSEHVRLSAEEEKSEAKQRGSIIVKVARGGIQVKPRIKARKYSIKLLPNETSKAVAVLHGKSHGLKSVTV